MYQIYWVFAWSGDLLVLLQVLGLIYCTETFKDVAGLFNKCLGQI